LSLPPVKTSQPQPEPNCLAVVSLKVFLKASKSPKSAEICLAIAPRDGHRCRRSWPGHQLPESGVVGVASAVIADHAADIFRNRSQVADEVVDGLGGQGGWLARAAFTLLT